MNQKVKCKKCGTTHVLNPVKHRNRPKWCTSCRSVLQKPDKMWKPNLTWIKEKLSRKEAQRVKSATKAKPIPFQMFVDNFILKARRGFRPGREKALTEIQQRARTAREAVEEKIANEKEKKEGIQK